MGLTTGLIHPGLWWGVQVLYLGLLILAAWRAPWWNLLRNRSLQHLLLGGAVFVLLLWQMRAGLAPGLEIRFLGMTAMTLVFGWELAVLAASLGMVGLSLVNGESWQPFAVSAFCYVVVPALVSQGVLRLVAHCLPRHFFIYLMFCSFLGAALATAAAGGCMALLLWLSDVYPPAQLLKEYGIYLPLIMLSEALVNGTLMAALLLNHPRWVRSFDPEVYFSDS